MRDTVLNKKGLYNRCKLTRLVVDQEWEDKVCKCISFSNDYIADVRGYHVERGKQCSMQNLWKQGCKGCSPKHTQSHSANKIHKIQSILSRRVSISLSLSLSNCLSLTPTHTYQEQIARNTGCICTQGISFAFMNKSISVDV